MFMKMNGVTWGHLAVLPTLIWLIAVVPTPFLVLTIAVMELTAYPPYLYIRGNIKFFTFIWVRAVVARAVYHRPIEVTIPEDWKQLF